MNRSSSSSFANDEEQTISGQLQPRQQSFAIQGPSGREIEQSGYEEGRADSQGRSIQSSEQVSTRIDQIERQVERLSQQLDDLRVSLRDMRQQSGRSDREHDGPV